MSDKCPKCGARCVTRRLPEATPLSIYTFECGTHETVNDRAMVWPGTVRIEPSDRRLGIEESKNCLRRQLAERDKTIEELRAAITTPEICAGVVRREVETRLAAANTTIDKLLAAAIETASNQGECSFDHDGNCQTHNLERGDNCNVRKLRACITAAEAARSKP